MDVLRNQAAQDKCTKPTMGIAVIPVKWIIAWVLTLFAGIGATSAALADGGPGSPDLAPAEIMLGPAPNNISGSAAFVAAEQGRVAAVHQDGEGLAAHIQQDGAALEAQILQSGFGHAAIITQQGSDSEALIIQSGSHHQADIAQVGTANLALIEQVGSGKSSSIIQHGQNTTVLVRQY